MAKMVTTSSGAAGYTVHHDDNIAIISDPSGDEASHLTGDKTNNEYKKPTVHIQEPPVSDMRGYEVVQIVEKHGPFHSAIPVMPLPLAVLFCLLNIVVPGSGTLLSAPASFCCATRHTSRLRAFFYNILAAFLQMLTFLVIVGWIWSIRWGLIMVQLARAPKRADNGNLPYYVRRQSSIEQQRNACTA